MEFELVKDWKEKEIQSLKDNFKKWEEEKDKLHDILSKKEEILKKAKDEYFKSHGTNPEYNKGHYKDEELDKLLYDKEKANDNYWKHRWSNKLFNEYGYSRDFEDRLKKLVDKHFNKLQDKVEKKIGKILKIRNCGGDDYLFQGEDANCKVEVILAGGYNIQRLHTRWIVKDIWKTE